MSLESVTEYFKQFGLEDRIFHFDESTATVEDAANVLGVQPDQIAKTLAFQTKEKPIIIVTEGTAKVSNHKYKQLFHEKAHMVSRDQLVETIGHPAGGVTPFALNKGVAVYLDETLKKHDILYPAAGIPTAAIKLSLEELEKYARPFQWVDITQD